MPMKVMLPRVIPTAVTAAALALGFVLALPCTTHSQILVSKQGPVVYGHHHLNTTNMDAQKKFFVDTLGGKHVKFGQNNQEIIEFPNVLIFFRPMQAPTGGSIGTTVNHIGFSVPDLRPLVAKIKANGFKMITADSVAANVKVNDDIAAASPTTNLAFALGPEDVKVEFVEVKSRKDSSASRWAINENSHSRRCGAAGRGGGSRVRTNRKSCGCTDPDRPLSPQRHKRRGP